MKSHTDLLTKHNFHSNLCLVLVEAPLKMERPYCHWGSNGRLRLSTFSTEIFHNQFVPAFTRDLRFLSLIKGAPQICRQAPRTGELF